MSRDLIIELFLSVMSRGIGMDEGNRWPLKLVTSASLCLWLPHCAVTSRPNLRRAPLCWATASHLCDTFCLNITFLKVHLCIWTCTDMYRKNDWVGSWELIFRFYFIYLFRFNYRKRFLLVLVNAGVKVYKMNSKHYHLAAFLVH